MAKKKLLWIIVLAVITVFAVCLAACGDKATRYSIKWEVSENATVTVEDSDELPSEAKEGSTVSFTVEADKGYEVSAVRVNDRTVSADSSGKYNVIIRSDTTIKVETEDTVESVTVSTNPATMTYYEGQTLDPEGMVVSVKYAGSGKTEAVTNYTVVYQNGNAFALGDTFFSVKYLGVESAPVQLTKAVEVLITIDPAGGTLDAGYLSGLQENSELHDVAQDEDGVITFSYSEITADIALPTADMWTRGEEGDYTFTGWTNGATKIAADNVTSQTYEAQYRAGLLKLTHVEYRNEQVGDELVPYLVIEGTFNAATEAYLFLYEGNKNIELTGDVVGGEGTKRGDPFELKFDMRKLTAKGEEDPSYIGAWFDIKFVASDGEREETQEIPIDDYADVDNFVDTEQVLVNGAYAFSFATYDGGNGNMLKALYQNYFMNEYTMEASVDDEGNAVVTFKGTVDKNKYAGKAACIDVELNGIHEFFGAIDENGQYTVVVNLGGYALNADGYFHFRIVESVTDNTVVHKEAEGNLLNAGCQNDNLETISVGLIENNGALRVANSDDTAVYYVGKGMWGGIVLRGVNEAVEITGVTLETKNEKPYLVINGTYSDKFTEETIIPYLKADMFAELLNNGDASSGSVSTDWNGTQLTYEGDNATILVEADAGGWKVYLDLSARNNLIGEVLFVHFSLDGATGTNLESTNIDTETKITFTETDGDKIEFSLGEFTTWGGHVVSIYVKAAPEAAA